jgi:hypothetical protein
MKYTLLELTQSILSSMDSDEINSIDDTVESQQVVEVIKTVYDDIITRGDMNINKTLFNLTPSNDVTKPVLMTKPDNIDRIEWIKYNRILNGDVDPLWDQMTYLTVEQFMDYTHQYKPSDSNIESFDYINNGFIFTFMYRNDWSPKYYTSFDDVTLIFDGYDSTVSSTLEASKTLCYGPLKSTFTKTDDFVPNLQPQQFALLLNEAKSLAWAELKQTGHAKAEQTSKRNWRHLQKVRENIPESQFGSNAHPFDKLPNFSRIK